MPTGICLFFMTTSDRWFVRYYHGEVDLGVFAVGSQIVLIFTYGIETFRKAWWPIAIKSMYEKNSKKLFNQVSQLFCGLGMALIIIFTFISSFIVEYFIDERFADAEKVIGILSFQGFFYGFIMIATAGMWKLKKTYINLYIIFFAFIIGLFLNWILVPNFGIQGASIATAITFFIWSVTSIIISEKLWSFYFNVSKFIIQTLLASSYVVFTLLYKNLVSFNVCINNSHVYNFLSFVII